MREAAVERSYECYCLRARASSIYIRGCANCSGRLAENNGQALGGAVRDGRKRCERRGAGGSLRRDQRCAAAQGSAVTGARGDTM